VITRYNHSPLYAMAIFQFSQQLKQGFNATAIAEVGQIALP
jgi:membrane-bound lytic murein transglycosylase B